MEADSKELLSKVYQKVDGLLDQINYKEIWEGFSRKKLYLYQKEWVCGKEGTFPWNESFVGNTTIVWKDEQVAIWKISEDTKVEDDEEMKNLVAGLVHEMFHAFQMERKEGRFPDDLKRLTCRETAEDWYYEMKCNQFLSQSVKYLMQEYDKDKNQTEELSNLFEQCVDIRRKHLSLNADLVEQIELLETAEGMAEYAGCMALKQLSGELFARRIEDYGRKIIDTEYLFNHERTSAYLFGMLFLLVARAAGYDLKHQIGVETNSIGGCIRKQMDETKLLEIEEWRKKLQQKEEWKMRQFEEFLSKESVREDDQEDDREGDFTIIGYDPMNMVRIENQILCKTFLRLEDDNKEAVTFFEPVLLTMKPYSANQVSGYKRKK